MLYNGQKVDTPKYVVDLAREQRDSLTQSEQLMWSRLSNRQLHGFRFRCQHPVYRYILDFYCHSAMLAIEIDGDIHKCRKEYDNYRDEFLSGIGVTTLRFSADEVMNTIEDVIERICSILLKQVD